MARIKYKDEYYDLSQNTSALLYHTAADMVQSGKLEGGADTVNSKQLPREVREAIYSDLLEEIDDPAQREQLVKDLLDEEEQQQQPTVNVSENQRLSVISAAKRDGFRRTSFI